MRLSEMHGLGATNHSMKTPASRNCQNFFKLSLFFGEKTGAETQLEIFTLEVRDRSQASRSERRSICGNATDLSVGAVPGTSWFVETVPTVEAHDGSEVGEELRELSPHN